MSSSYWWTTISTDLDWDTMPGLFDHLDTVKATLIDLEIITGQVGTTNLSTSSIWMELLATILALVLFLTPNHQTCIESTNEVLGDYVFLVVVMYKPMAQCTCPLCSNAVNDLCEFAQDQDASPWLSSAYQRRHLISRYPLRLQIMSDYAIVLVDNVMTRVVIDLTVWDTLLVNYFAWLRATLWM